MKFHSPKEMLNFINDGNDIYSPSKGLYIFNYNECGSVCVYFIDEDEANKLSKLSKEHGEYWAAFLGCGGHIYDEDYTKDRQSNMQLCSSLLQVTDWVLCSEYEALE